MTAFRIRLRSCRVRIDKNIAFAKERERQGEKTLHVRSPHSQVAPALHSTAGRSRCRARRVPYERDVAYFRHDVSRRFLRVILEPASLELTIIKTPNAKATRYERGRRKQCPSLAPYFWLQCQILKISIKTPQFFVIVTRFGDYAIHSRIKDSRLYIIKWHLLTNRLWYSLYSWYLR